MTQGSELMAMRTVSKTVNPGSNPGSPARFLLLITISRAR